MTVYFDHAATSFPKSEKVYRAMDEAGRRLGMNAGRGSYSLAREAALLIQNTRDRLRRAAETDQAAEVVLTASATLALNAVIGGLDLTGEKTVYVSPYEHNAVMRTLYGYQQKQGFLIQELPLSEHNLELDLEKTAYLFAKEPPDFLFLNMVSNVTGYVLPAAELIRIARSYDCTVVLDGAQALGCMPVSMKELDADFLIFAGHKALGGPFGIGGYFSNGKHGLRPVFYGGTGSNSLSLKMPEGVEGFEPGSPNIVAIAGLYAALEELQEPSERRNIWEEERQKTDDLLTKLSRIPGIRLYQAPQRERQAGILSVNLAGYRAGEVGTLLDEDYEIAVRTGYHCAPLIHKHLRDEAYGGTVRISLGRFTARDQIDKIADALMELSQEA